MKQRKPSCEHIYISIHVYTYIYIDIDIDIDIMYTTHVTGDLRPAGSQAGGLDASRPARAARDLPWGANSTFDKLGIDRYGQIFRVILPC